MKWKTLKGYYFQNFMDEIEEVRNQYMELIKTMQNTKKESLKKDFLNLRKAIEERITEIDGFLEDNFDKPFVLNFEKGKIKLRKILLITPSDKLNTSTMDKYFKNIDFDINTLKDNNEDDKGETPIYNIVPKEMNKFFNYLDKKEKEEKLNLKNEINNKSRNILNISKKKTSYTSFKSKEKIMLNNKSINQSLLNNTKNTNVKKNLSQSKRFHRNDSSTIKKINKNPISPKNSFFQPAREVLINSSNKNFFKVEKKKKNEIKSFSTNDDNNPISPIQRISKNFNDFQKEEDNDFFSNEEEDDAYLTNLIKKTTINKKKTFKFKYPFNEKSNYKTNKNENNNNNSLNNTNNFNYNDIDINSFKKPKKFSKSNIFDNKRLSFNPYEESNNSKSKKSSKIEDIFEYYVDEGSLNENEELDLSSSDLAISYIDDKEILIKLILNPKEYGLLLKERAYKAFTLSEHNN